MSAAPAVVARDLVRRFGTLVAVDGVSFEVARGETFGVIGPDGAGKTTILRMLLGLLGPDAGTVRTCGVDPRQGRRELSRRVGYLAQRFSLYADLTVDENVAFFAEVHGIRGFRPRRDELLERLRLAPFRRRLAGRLSGGMRQKLALACTLVHTPELIVLDEPTTGVDPVSRRELWRILSRLQREGLTVVVTTPALEEAERCQRVALLHRGRVLSMGTPDALRRELAGSVLEVLARPRRDAQERLRARLDVADVVPFGERLHVTLPSVAPHDAPGAAAAIEHDLRAAGIEVEAVRAVPASLEDFFVARIQALREAS